MKNYLLMFVLAIFTLSISANDIALQKCAELNKEPTVLAILVDYVKDLVDYLKNRLGLVDEKDTIGVEPGVIDLEPRVIPKTESGEERLNKIIASDGIANDLIKGILTTPSEQTSSCATYKVGDKKINPGEHIYLAVPEHLRGRNMSYLVLAHRQDPSTETGWNKKTEYDDVPGMTSVYVHDEDGSWRYWAGSSSGGHGAKYAEISHSPEYDNLYEWPKVGNRLVKGGDRLFKIAPDGIKLRGSGSDHTIINQLNFCVLPEKASKYDIHIFTPGLNFGDPETLSGRSYGEKKTGYGIYPKAEVIGSYSKPSLIYPINNGENIVSIEVSAGDLHNNVDYQNDDGGFGTKGWGKLSMGVQRSDGSVVWFSRNENVGPEGFYTATPPLDFENLPGDKVIINGRSDNIYVMGVRIGTQ